MLANDWSGERLVLRVKSQTVGDDPYTTWIYCPKGFSVRKGGWSYRQRENGTDDQKAEGELSGHLVPRRRRGGELDNSI